VRLDEGGGVQRFDEDDSKESMVSKILTENTTKKVIIFVLVILIGIPLFDLNKISDIDAQNSGLQAIGSPF